MFITKKLNYILNNDFNNLIINFNSNFKTCNSKSSNAVLKINFRDFIFYFQQMNKILHKPFTKYCYNFLLAFKKYHTIVADKEYAHQFCFFLNLKLKNIVGFYFVEQLDNLFFSNYEENSIVNFFIPCKGNKIDWTLFKYFWGQTKKYPFHYIELNYYDIDMYEVNKVLFFFKFYSLKNYKTQLILKSSYTSNYSNAGFYKLNIIKKYYKKFIFSKKNLKKKN